jgi:rare lipoprotein A
MLAVCVLASGCGSQPYLGKSAKAAVAEAPVATAPEPTRAEPPAAAAAAPEANPAPSRPASARASAGSPPDAVPRVERISTTLPNLPYRVRGEDYQPHNSDVPMRETGIASWYGEPFHGRRTANGEVYDMDGMTAAHKTMPLPSYAVVRNRRNGKEVVVRVNDRGPFKDGRVIDLSRAAARKLGFTGLADVEVRRLTHADIRTGAWKQSRQTLASAGP